MCRLLVCCAEFEVIPTPFEVGNLYFKIYSYLPDFRESVIFPYISLYTQAVAYTTYVESAARRALKNTSKRRLLSLGSLWSNHYGYGYLFVSRLTFRTESLARHSMVHCTVKNGTRSGLNVCAVASDETGWSGLGSSPGLGHCVVSLCGALYSHSIFLYPGV